MNTKIHLARFTYLLVLLSTCTTPLYAQIKSGSHSQIGADYLPKQFAWFLENGKDHYEVMWNGKALQYFTVPFHFGPIIPEVKEVTPSPQAWKRFWQEMDAIQVWHWLKKDNSPLLSTQRWGLIFKQRGKNGQTRIISNTSDYPSDAEVSQPTQREVGRPPRRSKVFERLLGAVRELLGDKEFD